MILFIWKMCHWPPGPLAHLNVIYLELTIHGFSTIPPISSLSNHPNFAVMAEGSDLNLTNYLEEVEKASPGILNAYIKQVWTFPTRNPEDIDRFHVKIP
jgi:hypothetical protein